MVIRSRTLLYVLLWLVIGGLHLACGDADGTGGGSDANADLSMLSLSQGALAPTFHSATTGYTASVANAISEVTLTPTKATSGGSVTVQGSPVESGKASSPIALTIGVNTIRIVVLAMDGTTQKTYTIALTRGAGSSGTGVVSRTSGVAPLSVHFWPGFLEHPEASARFRNVDYTWDFGDGSSGVWGTTGTSKNRAKGPVAVHIFETPGVYTVSLVVRDASGQVASESYEITVLDPDTFYSGTKTTCVSDTSHADFTGAPAGSRHITTDDLSTITQYATAGSRILFQRGSSWMTAALTWPENGGPVTLGAYGSGINPDALGLYENAPTITVTGDYFLTMDSKQDWRIMDLRLVDPTRTHLGAFGGSMEMQRDLFLRLKIEGFWVPLGWSTWNTSRLMTIDHMVVASCDLSDSDTNLLFVGSERLALLGNIARNARTSHVVRVWQAYRGVISHNLISGSSLDTTAGRHALKLHGPKETELSPADANGHLHNRSEFNVISGNAFGSSGPWPINIAPQDAGSDERISNLLFERNRYHQDFGLASSTDTQIALRLAGRYITARNNILDGAGLGNNFNGIAVVQEGIEPPPVGVELYNNTIFRSNNGIGNERVGIVIAANASGTVARNNLVSFTGATVPITLINNGAPDTILSNNLLNGTVAFADPAHPDPLQRSFALTAGATGAIDQGYAIDSVLEDFAGNVRPNGSAYDIGALER
jgi:PKD repeat protein